MKKKYLTHNSKPCLMAYSINNRQPVICTIVADQPYFYMDETYEELELETTFVEVPAKVVSKSLGYEEFKEQFLELSDELSIETPQKDVLDLENLNKLFSSVGFINQTFSKHIDSISFSDQVSTVEVQNRTLKLNKNLPLETALFLSAISVREASRKYSLFDFEPEEAVLYNKLSHVDLIYFGLRFLWELKLLNGPKIWDNARKQLEYKFEQQFKVLQFICGYDFRALRNGQALILVLENYFTNCSVFYPEKQAIQRMLSSSESFDIERKKIPLDIQVLKNLFYVEGDNQTILNYKRLSTLLTDPIFTEVRNRSNANFLWFIKFERSFRETEESLK